MDIAVIGLLKGALVYAVPLWFAAVGELTEQFAGVLGLGIEGTMLIGAFVGYLIALKTDVAALGLFGGVGAGILAGLVVSAFVVRLGRSQIVTGIGLNILAAGLTSYLFVEAITKPYGRVPYISVMPGQGIPGLADIPIIGSVFFTRPLVVYGAFFLFPLVFFLLYRTSVGLRIRAVGESAAMCNALGVNVGRYRMLAAVFAGAMAGLAGAVLVLGATGAFTHGMTVGRGFLAISTVIVSNWTLRGVLIIGFLFGLVQSGQQALQVYFPALPWQLMLAVPYVVGIVALVVGALRARQPSELGLPFLRQR